MSQFSRSHPVARDFPAGADPSGLPKWLAIEAPETAEPDRRRRRVLGLTMLLGASFVFWAVVGFALAYIL